MFYLQHYFCLMIFRDNFDSLMDHQIMFGLYTWLCRKKHWPLHSLNVFQTFFISAFFPSLSDFSLFLWPHQCPTNLKIKYAKSLEFWHQLKIHWTWAFQSNRLYFSFIFISFFHDIFFLVALEPQIGHHKKCDIVSLWRATIW